jgi:hypothetical protein
VIETTGLAQPAPIIQTFFLEPSVSDRMRLDGVVTMVSVRVCVLFRGGGLARRGSFGGLGGSSEGRDRSLGGECSFGFSQRNQRGVDACGWPAALAVLPVLGLPWSWAPCRVGPPPHGSRSTTPAPPYRPPYRPHTAPQVDAKHVELHLDEQKPEGVVNEALEQIAYADRVILNKTDLVSGGGRGGGLLLLTPVCVEGGRGGWGRGRGRAPLEQLDRPPHVPHLSPLPTTHQEHHPPTATAPRFPSLPSHQATPTRGCPAPSSPHTPHTTTHPHPHTTPPPRLRTIPHRSWPLSSPQVEPSDLERLEDRIRAINSMADVR